VLFGLLAAEPRLQDKEPVMWLFLIWSMIEMIRSGLTIQHVKEIYRISLLLSLLLFV